MIRGASVLLVVVAGTAAAQNDPRANLMYPLQQRVRVATAPPGSPIVVGRVARVDSSHLELTVTNAGTVAVIPLSAVASIESDGGIDRRRGVRRGALVGLALGTYFFATEYPELRENDQFGVGAMAMALVSFGIAPGAGALVGYVIAPRKWTPLAVPPPSGSGSAPAIRFAADEYIRLRTRGSNLSGRVFSQTRTLVTVTTDDARVPVAWSDVERVRVRGGKDRRKGALAGALLGIGIGILGEQSAPTTSSGERIGAFAGSALVFGYLGSRWLAPRGWTDLPVPRATP